MYIFTTMYIDILNAIKDDVMTNALKSDLLYKAPTFAKEGWPDKPGGGLL